MQPDHDEPLPNASQPRDPKVGFMSRRRRLRNRWNIHMRKDERARERGAKHGEGAAFAPALES